MGHSIAPPSLVPAGESADCRLRICSGAGTWRARGSGRGKVGRGTGERSERCWEAVRGDWHEEPGI